MKKPVMSPSGPLAYSQLQRMVYSLLQPRLRNKHLNVSQIHERWKKISRATCVENMRKLERALANTPEFDIPIHVRRVLIRILDHERCDLAAAWLSGNQSLQEADYQCLGVQAPLGDDEIPDLIKQLGHLSVGTGPIVLILDQLERLVRPDQVHEIEALMIDLNDGSRNWYVIVSLVHEKFDLWHSTLSKPFRDRFGTVTHDSVNMSTAELSPLSNEQGRQLIMARLGTAALRFQRESDKIDDPCYPLSELVVQQLTSSDISTARMLIQKALQAYVGAVTGDTRPATTKLCDFVDRVFADLRSELREEDLGVDSASTADRVEELFGLLWLVRANSAIQGTDGPLHAEVHNFEGVDRIYACNDIPLRVVLYDVQQTNKFPSILKKIENSSPSTILIRDGRISVSGKATRARLEMFQKDKRFFHLSLDQVRNLHALGNLLAKMREGEFNNEETEPKPTERGIYECLAQNREIVETDLAHAFLAMVGLESESHGEKTPDGVETTEPDDPIVIGLARIMEEERWMSFERLCVRVSSRGISADPQKVYQRLKARPLCDSVLIYPRHVNLLESIGIVIWSLEE